MAKFFDTLSESLIHFIEKQRMFFVASAPAHGRVNLSPKGMDTFRCLDEKTVAYLDVTGSGNETSAHVHENGRVTIMFCSFDDEPLILRIYGRGEIVHPGNARWDALAPRFDVLPGARQIVVAHVESVQTSCGFAVPRYDFIEHRQKLVRWAEKQGEDGLAEYRAKNNRTSIDGAPTGLS